MNTIHLNRAFEIEDGPLGIWQEDKTISVFFPHKMHLGVVFLKIKHLQKIASYGTVSSYAHQRDGEVYIGRSPYWSKGWLRIPDNQFDEFRRVIGWTFGGSDIHMKAHTEK